MFTAHIRTQDNVVQTVEEHCKNVADLAAEYAEGLGCEAIIRLAAERHDYGKLTKDFDDYIHGRTRLARGEIDHSFAGARYIVEKARELNAPVSELAASLAAKLIISHHGLHDWIDTSGDNYFLKRTGKIERYEEIKTNIENLISNDQTKKLIKESEIELEAICKKIFDISDGRSVDYQFYLGMLERVMLSILVDADRTDTGDFMAGESLSLHYDIRKIWCRMEHNLNEKLEKFRLNKDPIAKWRMDISDRCESFAGKKRGICRLIVPTGGGKTLASMRFSIRYCCNEEFHMKRIIYIAPFMSILEQNSSIIKELMDEEDQRFFLEHHSDILSSMEAGEELSEYELRCEKWDNAVISTTFVQFLNTLFSNKMSSVRRMHRLANSVIIIDEIQSMPLKCVNLFKLAMNFLAEVCGCTIILCSATQPSFEEGTVKLRIDKEESMTGDYRKDFNVLKRTSLVPVLRKKGYTFDETAEFCFEKYKENNNLLLIVNTKKAALRIYEKLKEVRQQFENPFELIHISTSMCPKHRKDMIAHMVKLLEEKKEVICITTQLIEAGVDVSFSCVVRSLAGLDNVTQAAGRCNRNGEMHCRPVYLINITEENIGKLKQIKESQLISQQLILNNPETFADYDHMVTYFQNLYKNFKDELSYPVQDMGVQTTLVSMLSDNKVRADINPQKNFTGPAFASAGELFEVISNNTIEVLVPYNDEAKEIILRLNEEISPKEEIELLRKAQGYMVCLYSNFLNKLSQEGAVYQIGDKRKRCVTVVRKEYYDLNCGVTLEAGLREVLLF
ncbi:MAG: CRISPR-associated helicase Cas3' [Lachnospiraceae bacterium]|nr:CRISPR-associated helicase Cas3' [Lachnospiraceae bacterium]